MYNDSPPFWGPFDSRWLLQSANMSGTKSGSRKLTRLCDDFKTAPQKLIERLQKANSVVGARVSLDRLDRLLPKHH